MEKALVEAFSGHSENFAVVRCQLYNAVLAACAQHGAPLYPVGLVWDSCPGPRPVVTLPRGLVLCLINWLSR